MLKNIKDAVKVEENPSKKELVMYFQKFTQFDFYASSFAVDQYLKAYDLQPETVLFIDTNLQSFLKYICLFIDNVLCIDGSVYTSYKVRFVEPANVNSDDIRRLTTL